MKKSKRKVKLDNNKIIMILSFIIIIIFFIYAFSKSSVFDLVEINIKGNENISRESILEQSSLQLNKNIFEISKKDIEKKLLENPHINSVNVDIKMPNTIDISLDEKEIIVIKKQGEIAYIDENGKYIKDLTYINKDYQHIYINLDYNIDDKIKLDNKNSQNEERVIEIIRLLKHNKILNSVKNIEVDTHDKIKITTNENIDILLSENQYKKNIEKVNEILADLESKSIKHGTINFEYDSYVLYTPQKYSE